MEPSKIKILLVGACLIVAIFLLNRGPIRSPGRAHTIEIYYQVGELLIKEFGFDIQVKEFNIHSNTDKAIQVDESHWKLRGTRIVQGEPVSWNARVEWIPGGETARLLHLESNGVVYFPNPMKSELEFDADEDLRLRAK